MLRSAGTTGAAACLACRTLVRHATLPDPISVVLHWRSCSLPLLRLPAAEAAPRSAVRGAPRLRDVVAVTMLAEETKPLQR